VYVQQSLEPINSIIVRRSQVFIDQKV